MKGCDKENLCLVAPERQAVSGPPVAVHNLTRLSWLLDYELRSAYRYRRYVTILMISSPVLPALVFKVKRDSDRLFVLDRECALLMPETDLAGAMTVVGRYAAQCGGDVDLRFSTASFPADGVNGLDLLGTVYRRLNEARTLPWGTVVCSG